MTSGKPQPTPEELFRPMPELIEIQSQAFARLERWMDRRLDILEARWGHLASPAARRVSQRRKRPTG